MFHKIRQQKFHLIRNCHLAWQEYKESRLVAKENVLSYTCNICGSANRGYERDVFDRETPSCGNCNSNLRSRAIIDILTDHLYCRDTILAGCPKEKSITGIGFSDWEGYADLLAEKFSYTNTYYHKEPLLDITKVSSSHLDKYDFIIISEVLEHIVPPVQTGFTNLYNMLKPGGLCILTAPYMLFEKTLEKYPDLYDFSLIKQGGETILKNTTKNKETQFFEDLVFHGGKGETLEMRIFTDSSLQEMLHKVGFQQITFHRESKKEYGINWYVNWSLPLSAKKII